MSSREAELYKDRIEVSLDGRQIFYLFFGGAVIVGLVFVLGVMVGRRVEARGHVDRAESAATSDPLAALDRLESAGELSFKGALGGAAPASELEREIAAKAEPKQAEAAKKQAEGKKIEDRKAEDRKPEGKKSEDKKSEDKKSEDKKVDDKKAEESRAEDRKAEDRKPEDRKAEDRKPEDRKPDRSDDRKADADSKPAGEARARFTLQLSSFQDRHEADAFLTSIKSAGYQAYVTEAEVGGKMFYRVRLGTYRSLEAASDAKAELEKAGKTASVMKL